MEYSGQYVPMHRMIQVLMFRNEGCRLHLEYSRHNVKCRDPLVAVRYVNCDKWGVGDFQLHMAIKVYPAIKVAQTDEDIPLEFPSDSCAPMRLKQ